MHIRSPRASAAISPDTAHPLLKALANNLRSLLHAILHRTMLELNVHAVILIPRHKMNMEMEHRLPGNLPVILEHIQAIAMQGIPQHLAAFLCHGKNLVAILLRQFIQIGGMSLGQDNAVPLGGGINIHNHIKILILIDGIGRQLTICQLAKNTLFMIAINT